MWMDMGHMGWGSGYGGMIGYLPMLLWWAVLIAGIALLVKWLFFAGGGGRRAGRGHAREILAERYARGEIDRDEFETKRRELTHDRGR